MSALVLHGAQSTRVLVNSKLTVFKQLTSGHLIKALGTFPLWQ